jgi:hypothetical protein
MAIMPQRARPRSMPGCCSPRGQAGTHSLPLEGPPLEAPPAASPTCLKLARSTGKPARPCVAWGRSGPSRWRAPTRRRTLPLLLLRRPARGVTTIVMLCRAKQSV